MTRDFFVSTTYDKIIKFLTDSRISLCYDALVIREDHSFKKALKSFKELCFCLKQNNASIDDNPTHIRHNKDISLLFCQFYKDYNVWCFNYGMMLLFRQMQKDLINFERLNINNIKLHNESFGENALFEVLLNSDIDTKYEEIIKRRCKKKHINYKKFSFQENEK